MSKATDAVMLCRYAGDRTKRKLTHIYTRLLFAKYANEADYVTWQTKLTHGRLS